MLRVVIFCALIWLLVLGFWEGQQRLGTIPGTEPVPRTSLFDFARMDHGDILGQCSRRYRALGDCDRFATQANGAVALCLSTEQWLKDLPRICKRWLLRTLVFSPASCVQEFTDRCSGSWGVLRKIACYQSETATSNTCQDWQAAIRRVVKVL